MTQSQALRFLTKCWFLIIFNVVTLSQESHLQTVKAVYFPTSYFTGREPQTKADHVGILRHFWKCARCHSSRRSPVLSARVIIRDSSESQSLLKYWNTRIIHESRRRPWNCHQREKTDMRTCKMRPSLLRELNRSAVKKESSQSSKSKTTEHTSRLQISYCHKPRTQLLYKRVYIKHCRRGDIRAWAEGEACVAGLALL